ncbi:arabinosyltransferase domain-containing protein [Gordonia sp. (in: high G+C Gram-positive bacteria)]|uniref:arabinosyltransferase domain-containing protein n=1 Tax=Gordonia sp. (in: high G+C Gram-positive bacteria) TaxID=84139 RepID=UPI0016B6B4E7|nr:arabinosyltransferase domain-containing protein [Gordonia sp. (in: high G+C Gram-positive bacteria)]NLG48444.1 arabinosyltransferase [Gordonia sp. (in: high G+C Gram-positive bacteria)]
MPAFSVRRAQITAIITGVLGVLLALATPLMPVKQTVAEISWPQNATVESISSPLFSYAPIDLEVDIPCRAVDDLPQGKTVLLSTTSPSAPKASDRGLFARVTNSSEPTVEVVTRNIPILSAPLSEVRSAACQTLEIRATSDSVSAEFVGLTDSAGDPRKAETGTDNVPGGDQRPQVTGLFTQLSGPASALPGLRAHMTVDSRYTTAPTITKWLAIIIGVLCTLISLAALARLDATDRRGHRRIFPARWWRLNPRDWTVIGLLVVWHLIGPNTSDDGYLMTMSRVAQESDYTANYFRWFGAPEAPFGWYYEVFGLLSHVSVASPWMRLPALACGIISWLIISHEVLPRIGRAARVRAAVPWTAAAVFLVAWFPFNNGLRPEPIICLGALLTWCSVERAIATGRLLPAAIACTAGAFSIAAGPTGVLAIAALVAGARPVFLALRRRAIDVDATTGRGATAAYASMLAPIVAAGTFVIFVVFSKLTLSSFTEASAMKTALGPSLNWYNEIDRYSSLFAFSADGSIARRFAVLTMVLGMTIAGAVLIRKSRIPGTALGPSRRIVGITFGSLLFLMFTPTKWTHHFGVFAGLAAALAALATIAASAQSTHSRRNRTIFGALVLFVSALAMTASNSSYYASAWGMPWGTAQVHVAGMPLGDILLYAALALLLLALWFHFREPFTGADPEPRTTAHPSRLRRAAVATTRFVASAPLGIVAGVTVAFLIWTAAMAGVHQSDSFSVPRSNFAALAGEPCGMADKVLVETDPSDYLLDPVDTTLKDPLAGSPTHSREDSDRGPTAGFTPDGIPDEVLTKASSGSLGVLARDASYDPDLLIANSGGTGGGTTATAGVNGSHAKLPFELDPARTAVMGSYNAEQQSPSTLTSGWYRLPADYKDFPLITLSAAGIFPSANLKLEYTDEKFPAGAKDDDIASTGSIGLIDPGPRPSWRNVRIDTASLPDDLTAVRISATDYDLAADHFMAVTPPRLPKMTTLQETVGSTDPTHVDWTSGLFVPCQRPFNFHAGVAEIPKWRVRPGADLAAVSAWQGALGGGPLGWLDVSQRADTVATYLSGDIGRDWGALERYTPYDDAVPAQIDYSEQVRSGLWSPSPIRY